MHLIKHIAAFQDQLFIRCPHSRFLTPFGEEEDW
jgi:hypothetical protein